MNSTWYKQCVEARTAKDLEEKKAADGEAKKKFIVLPIVFTIMCGGLIAAMLSNGNSSGVPVIAVIYVVLMLMSIMLISKKKGAPTALDQFKEAIEKYINTPELEAALDEEMVAAPIEGHERAGIYFTKTFFYKQFTDGSRMVYPISVVKSIRWGKDGSDYSCEMYDTANKHIIGFMCNKAQQAEVNALLSKHFPNIKIK